MMKYYILRDTFPEYDNWEIPVLLTYKVIELLTNASGIKEARPIAVSCHPCGPMCCEPTAGNLKALGLDLSRYFPADSPAIRLVVLNTEGARWSQWIYQSAHEICHHLTDGNMSGSLRGCQWFEETLCEAASLFCLSRLADPTLWRQWGCHRYALCVQSYLDTHLQRSFALRQEYYRWNHPECHPGITPWRGILEETSTQGIRQDQRILCNAVASLILPPFLRNNRLWGIISRIGDSARWPSIESLLSHMEATASPVDSEGVRELMEILLRSRS